MNALTKTFKRNVALLWSAAGQATDRKPGQSTSSAVRNWRSRFTQLFRIHDANRVAQADVRASRDELKNRQLQIALGVRQLYYGLLIAAAESKAAVAVTAASQREMTEAESDIGNGSALEIALIQAKASVLQNQQEELQARIQHNDLQAEFNNALGLAVDAAVELDDSPGQIQPPPSREECMRLTESAQPTILAAADTVSKARAALSLSIFLPSCNLFADKSGIELGRAEKRLLSNVPLVSTSGMSRRTSDSRSWTVAL